MAYWFQDPGIKSLLPLATSTSIKGLVTFFNSPALVIGANSLAEGFMPQPSIIDIFNSRCTTKRSFFVTDEYSERFALKASRVLDGAGLPRTSGTRPSLRHPLTMSRSAVPR